MDKMWAGRFSEQLNRAANDFNSSISVDSAMIESDIKGSIAHASMLGECGIISKQDGDKIIEELCAILADVKSGTLKIDFEAEDVHMFVEAELTNRIGEVGKRLHTARSRNDQVALDTRMHLMGKIREIKKELLAFVDVLVAVADKYADAIMPGYTHLQRAQPITFGHHLLAYANMFVRDIARLEDCNKRMNVCPLGSAALAGTTYPIDRKAVADKLGFDGVCANSMDGVSDRDFVVELASDLSIVMMHLSRLSEEVIMWCSWEFKFIELSDAYSTGSSIMPQKKNPDMAELVRGKTGRVYGNLMGILTVMKGLPLAYNKDMQEDKEGVFDSVDTVLACLPIFSGMLATATVRTENMLAAAKKGFINATDCADYLVKKGMAFRDAYKLTGQLVALCIKGNTTLDELPIETYKGYSELFDEDIYQTIDMKNCAEKRTSQGGASSVSVKAQIVELKKYLSKATAEANI